MMITDEIAVSLKKHKHCSRFDCAKCLNMVVDYKL